MLSISKLFDMSSEELDHRIIENKKASKYLDVENIPMMYPPEIGSTKFSKDLQDVLHHMQNPCLGTGFLNLSHDSVEEVFKNFCKESGVRIDWKYLKNIIKEVGSCISDLKKHHQRSRPKHFMHDYECGKIKDMDSYSFPSGHTAIAYFICDVLGNSFPNLRSELSMIARLIGQSRVENGVHFPSDITYGRLLGETLASQVLNSKTYNQSSLQKHRGRKHDRQFAKHLIGKKENIEDTIEEIANFLYITCSIESINVNYEKCKLSAKKLLTSVADNHLSDDIHILSQCKALRESFFLKEFSPNSAIRCHNNFHQGILDRGSPGEMRSYFHSSPSGIEYCKPENFIYCLNKLDSCRDPFLRHYLFEWIHPFCDGNGRVGRILLALDLDYDFEKINNFLLTDYIGNMNDYFHQNDIGGIFY